MLHVLLFAVCMCFELGRVKIAICSCGDARLVSQSSAEASPAQRSRQRTAELRSKYYIQLMGCLLVYGIISRGLSLQITFSRFFLQVL